MADDKIEVNFADKQSTKTRLYCARAPLTSRELRGDWYGPLDVARFVSTPNELNKESTFTLIAGTGNGTLRSLTVERDIFHQITDTLRFHDKVEEVISSIHRVIALFVEQNDGEKVLHILFSTPKAPVREIFCTIRVALHNSSISSIHCLLFDDKLKDLTRLVQILESSQKGMPEWHNVITILITLTKECGHSSEHNRRVRDDEILGAEVQTLSTPWNDPHRTLIRWPDNFLDTMNILHLCHNALTFIDRTVQFEIEVWEFLLQLMNEEAHPDCRTACGSNTGDFYRQPNLDNILFEIGLTRSRKTQIAGLKDRVQVQINLIMNLIAHKEISQSKMISVIALVFAPASLIVSIFSMPIFGLDKTSIGAFFGTFISITVNQNSLL